ncbi:hypothetical protein N9N28_16170 [Rubripirellula amarantea]|uniref:Uncharacterized protein n=1 Tax=Rubripirellula amarantea TaxID=2527999 RepID=A0A5C5WQK2_9BACT|nr:hypothetical protein [Rubripirellula amarantea]MDA8746162.1 hypothetical protein [Rubripirellula amarantea]TWT53174.1 hypothetical protein Pla22_08020 [Rubripirellula amarantea]
MSDLGFMTRERYRQIGAISGLLSGWAAMYLLGYAGLVPAAVFGITGCVLGGITAEKVHDRKTSDRK